MRAPLPVALLVSGEGTTMEALAERAADGRLPIRIVLVVADRPETPAIARARRRGLPTWVASHRGVDPERWSGQIGDALTAHGAELVVLAGFLSILPPSWVERWRGRAINVHPSLLPRYGGPGMYGRRVLEAVLAAGERTTGATVHLVGNEVDRGLPIAQERVPVAPGDTAESLRARLHPVEVELLARTLRLFADGSLALPYDPSEPGARAAGRRGGTEERG